MDQTYSVENTGEPIVEEQGGEQLVRKKGFWAKLRTQKLLVILSVPFVLYMLLFSYAPMIGLVMAFQDFSVESAGSLFDAPWVGWANFVELFQMNEFLLAFRNTVAMGVINLIAGTVSGILLALILNEVHNLLLKKITQTISYLPYFLSWVIVANLVTNMLSLDGITVVKRVFFIDLPCIAGQLKYFLVTGIIGGFQAYTWQLIFTHGGPGTHGATMVPGYLIYDTAFTDRQYGLSAAMGVILFLITLTLTIINMRMTNKVETEEQH